MASSGSSWSAFGGLALLWRIRDGGKSDGVDARMRQVPVGKGVGAWRRLPPIASNPLVCFDSNLQMSAADD